jgi:hypothetical protein
MRLTPRVSSLKVGELGMIKTCRPLFDPAARYLTFGSIRAGGSMPWVRVKE